MGGDTIPFDIGHASGPLLAGALSGLYGDQDFRAPFALIAAILVVSALAFRFGLDSGRQENLSHLFFHPLSFPRWYCLFPLSGFLDQVPRLIGNTVVPQQADGLNEGGRRAFQLHGGNVAAQHGFALIRLQAQDLQHFPAKFPVLPGRMDQGNQFFLLGNLDQGNRWWFRF